MMSQIEMQTMDNESNRNIRKRKSNANQVKQWIFFRVGWAIWLRIYILCENRRGNEGNKN